MNIKPGKIEFMREPKIVANESAEKNHELLKEIVRQYGKIIDLLTTTMIYIPDEPEK